MHQDTFLNSIRDHRFDVVITPGPLGISCMLILPYHLNLPFIVFASFNSPWTNGIPALPSFTKAVFYNADGPHGMYKKFISAFYLYYMSRDKMMIMSSTELLEEFAPHVTSWWALFRRAQLFLTYRDHMLNDPAPSMPYLIQTPALSYSDAKPLEPALANNMTSSHTIVISFGSTANTMPADVAQKFIDAFSQLTDYNVFWRLKNRDNLQLPGHVHLLDWLPQNDLLGHNTTRLFIAHCGAGGVYEALYHAVPILCFPLFAEQKHNAVTVAHRSNYRVRMSITKLRFQ